MKYCLRSVAASQVCVGIAMSLVFALAPDALASGVSYTPLSSSPIEQGAPYVTLISGTKTQGSVSATVTGPFVIALQNEYAYGSIDGFHFGTTVTDNASCTPTYSNDCSKYLLIELLPTAPVGLVYGTVTFSDGTSISAVVNVRPPGLTVTPENLQIYTAVGGAGDPLLLSLTNNTTAAISIGNASFIDPNGTGAAAFFTFNNGCGASLAAGATCILRISYDPTPTVSIGGYVQLDTGLGPIDVPLETEIDYPSPAPIQIDPQNLDFAVGVSGSSAVRAIKITNSGDDAESIQIPGAGPGCDPTAVGPCLNIVSNTCDSIPPHTSCEIDANFLVDPSRSFSGIVQGSFGFFVNPYTPPGAGFFSVGYSAYPAPGPPSPAVIKVSTAALQFPATPFGQASEPKMLTISNVSGYTLSLTMSSIPDFIVDPSCMQLLPGASCEIPVRYLPTSGILQVAQSLVITAANVTDPAGLTTAQAQQMIAVTGSALPQAALGSPFGNLTEANVFDSSVSLTVTNVSSAQLVFGSIYGNVGYYAGEGLTVDTTGCGATLAPGKSCLLVVNAHKCDDAGYPACYLFIESNALSSPDIYTFDGNQAADIHSRLTVDAGPIVFGQTRAGVKSPSQVVHVTLKNGSAPTAVPFTVLPVADPNFIVDNQCPAVLMPAAGTSQGYATSCDILVTFLPQSAGFHSGALAYRSSIQGNSVSLAGTGLAPTLQITPASLQFGPTTVGSKSAAEVVTITNPGDTALTVGSVTVMGGQADDFIVSNACDGTLAASSTCTIAVIFKPVSVGSKVSSMIIVDAAGNSTPVALAGTGIAPAAPYVSLSTSTLRFAKQAAGASAPTQMITVQNNGSMALAFSSLTIAGSQADDYLLSSTCGGSLAPGASCALTVAFDPVSAGTKKASIIIVDNASNSPQKVSLTGVGTVAGSLPVATLGTTGLGFSNQPTGTASAAQVVYLSNTGASTLTLDSIAVTGAQADDYIISSTCGASLTVGANCTVSVIFKPVSKGAKYADVTVTDNAGDSPQAFPMSGIGT